MLSEKLKKGYSYRITIIDGDTFTGEYQKEERGFLIFLDYANKKHVFRTHNVVNAYEVCCCCGCNPCDCYPND
jgi:hypothetical protein